MYYQENAGVILVLPYTESSGAIACCIIFIPDRSGEGFNIFYNVRNYRVIFNVYTQEDVTVIIQICYNIKKEALAKENDNHNKERMI